MKHLLSLSLLFIIALDAPESSANKPPADPLKAAELAFEDGRFQEALDLLEGLPDVHPRRQRSWFLRAYAHYKLQQLDQARELLDLLLRKQPRDQLDLVQGPQPTQDAAFLRGMIAVEQSQWELAIKLLDPLARSDTAPWSEMAQPLLGRAKAEQAAEQVAKQAAREQRQREERASRYRQTIAQVEALIKEKKNTAAAGAMQLAAALNPDHHLTAYYRGYLAYLNRRYPEAQTHLRRALSKKPADGWSRYMLAMAQDRAGLGAKARARLEELSRTATDREIRDAANLALKHQMAREIQPGAGPLARIGAGLGLDTNPDSFRERPAGKVKVTASLLVAGAAAYRWLFRRSIQLSVGLGLSERAYLSKQPKADLFEASPGFSLGLVRPLWSVSARYDYALQMYHYDPLSSLHHLSAQGLVTLAPWIELGASGRLTLQEVLHDEFRYLPHLGAGGRLGLRLHTGPATLTVTYGLRRDLARTAQIAPMPGSSSAGRGQPASSGASPTSEYDLTTNYTAWSHGPELQGSLALPWKLTLSARARLSLWRFAEESRLTFSSNGNTREILPRQDTRLTLEAELARALALGLELALRFDSVDNFSSVDEPQAGLDYTYSQRVFALWLRWRWGG